MEKQNLPVWTVLHFIFRYSLFRSTLNDNWMASALNPNYAAQNKPVKNTVPFLKLQCSYVIILSKNRPLLLLFIWTVLPTAPLTLERSGMSAVREEEIRKNECDPTRKAYGAPNSTQVKISDRKSLVSEDYNFSKMSVEGKHFGRNFYYLAGTIRYRTSSLVSLPRKHRKKVDTSHNCRANSK